jgi:Carboxypeptidase regulatory-like domain
VFKLFVYSLVLTWACLVTRGQTPAANERGKTANVRGIVANEATGAPLRKAFVRLSSRTSNYPAITNERGEFSVEGVQPGPYNLWAEAPGFIPSERIPAQSLRVDIEAEQTVTGLRLQLTHKL